jgi:CheY-like chemotaxis protein
MGPTLRILLAEDNPGDVFLIKEALKRHCRDFELTVAADGKAALELIQAAETSHGKTYNFFLLDLNLPARHGIELLAQIRRSSSTRCRFPVVIVTSSNAARDYKSSHDAGADYFFCKPSDYEEYLQLGMIVERLWSSYLRRLDAASGSRQQETIGAP